MITYTTIRHERCSVGMLEIETVQKPFLSILTYSKILLYLLALIYYCTKFAHT